MKALIASDIHANLEALNAAIADAESAGGFDQIWSLGDLVGYGPNPSEVIDVLRGREHVAVVGNHDLAAVGAIGLEWFNPVAAAANAWTSTVLDDDRKDFIRAQPRVLELDDYEFTMAHGSLRDPVWEYVTTSSAVRACLTRSRTYRCLVGHTHVPIICRMDDAHNIAVIPPRPDAPLPLRQDSLLINPGSIGQPRDGDPRASYAIYDSETETLTCRRAEYDVEKTQRKIISLGLPPFLAERLALGR